MPRLPSYVLAALQAYWRWSGAVGSWWGRAAAIAIPLLVGAAAVGALSGGDATGGEAQVVPTISRIATNTPVVATNAIATTTSVSNTDAAAAPAEAPALIQPTAVPTTPPAAPMIAPTLTSPPAQAAATQAPPAIVPTSTPPTGIKPLVPQAATPSAAPSLTPVPPTRTPAPPLPTATKAPANPSTYKPGNAYNCSDFATYAQAKAYFDAVPGDPSKLDADHDGIPCESLPGAP